MEKEINIAEILKDCPKGTELYSPVFGEVSLECVNSRQQICVSCIDGYEDTLDCYGIYHKGGECMLFPSKDQRDWSKFVKPVAPPFDIKREEVKKGVYYVLDNTCSVALVQEDFIEIDDLRFENGNYFNTSEQAEYAAGKVKELLLSMRKEVSNE